MRLDGDLPAIMLDAVRGKLDPASLGQTSQTALGVVITAKGYPGSYAKGLSIEGIEDADSVPGVKVFHSGTAVKDGSLVSNGGRVLCVTALGNSLAAAQKAAYAGVAKVRMQDGFHRTDIGEKGIRRLAGK